LMALKAKGTEGKERGRKEGLGWGSEINYV
jgi:hypothetical protein